MAEKVIDRFVTEFLFRGDKGNLDRIQRKVEGVQRRLNTMATRFTLLGAAMAAPLGGVLRKAYSTDEALRTLEARTGATADQLARLKQQAYEVGSELPLDTADILAAQTAYFQLGNTIKETMEATPTIARLAVSAKGVGVEEAARYLAFAKNNFDLTGEAALEFASRMLKAETITAATARGIGESMQFSAQSASDAGLSGATYIALLGGIAGAGREVESVSQGLNVLFTKTARAMSGFGRGGKMVKKAFAGVGIAVEEVRGIMTSGREDAIFDLLELIGARSPNQAAMTSALATLVGESYASALSFAIKDVDKLRNVYERLKATGVEEIFRQSNIQMKGLSGEAKSAWAQLDTLVNKLSDLELSEPAQRALRGFSDLVGWLVETDEQGRHLRAGWLGLIGTTLKSSVVLLGMGLALRGVSFALGGYVGLLKTYSWWTGISWKQTALFVAWTKLQAAGAWLSTQAMLAKTAAVGNLNRAYFLLNTQMGRQVLLSKLSTKWAVLSLGPFGRWITRVGAMGAKTLAFVAGMVSLKAVGALVLKGLALLAAALGGLPFLVVLAGVAALAASLYGLIAYWEDIASAARTAWEWMRKALGIKDTPAEAAGRRKGAETEVTQAEKQIESQTVIQQTAKVKYEADRKAIQDAKAEISAQEEKVRLAAEWYKVESSEVARLEYGQARDKLAAMQSELTTLESTATGSRDAFWQAAKTLEAAKERLATGTAELRSAVANEREVLRGGAAAVSEIDRPDTGSIYGNVEAAANAVLAAQKQVTEAQRDLAAAPEALRSLVQAEVDRASDQLSRVQGYEAEAKQALADKVAAERSALFGSIARFFGAEPTEPAEGPPAPLAVAEPARTEAREGFDPESIQGASLFGLPDVTADQIAEWFGIAQPPEAVSAAEPEQQGTIARALAALAELWSDEPSVASTPIPFQIAPLAVAEPARTEAREGFDPESIQGASLFGLPDVTADQIAEWFGIAQPPEAVSAAEPEQQGTIARALAALAELWSDEPSVASTPIPFQIAPPAVAEPAIPAAAFAGAGGQAPGGAGPRTISFEVGEIRVDAPGADSKEIAQNIGAELRDQWQDVARDADNPVALP